MTVGIQRSSNCTVVNIGKVHVLFSYSTLVAFRANGERHVYRHPSTTTSRHLNENGYGKGTGCVEHDSIEHLQIALEREIEVAVRSGTFR